MLKQIDSYDWREAFGYAGEPDTEGRATVSRVEGAPESVALDPFTREDVAKIVALSEGENDGANWIGVFELKDGRFAFLSAGCDYTGWDCQAGGCAVVADSLERLLRFGLGTEDRERLGLAALVKAVHRTDAAD